MDTHTYEATDVAKFLIHTAHEYGDTITHLKLQKLLYYVQGSYLALQNHQIFKEDILAWKNGPVVYSVWNMFKHYHAEPINEPDDDTGIDGLNAEIIKEIYRKYRGFTAGQLVSKTHDENPWKDSDSDDVISVDSIQDYFTNNVYNADKMFHGIPTVEPPFPASWYDASEDSWYDEWKRGKAV
jgi:uncharacterized phage-associated protein